MYRGGLGFMRYSVSDTAEHGDYTGGPRLVTEETKNEMRKMLAEIRSGAYAEKLARETKSGWFRPSASSTANTRSSRSARSSARACRSSNRWPRPASRTKSAIRNRALDAVTVAGVLAEARLEHVYVDRHRRRPPAQPARAAADRPTGQRRGLRPPGADAPRVRPPGTARSGPHRCGPHPATGRSSTPWYSLLLASMVFSFRLSDRKRKGPSPLRVMAL